MDLKISVVIPLYNKAPYIMRALNSVLGQTCPPSEVVVVNDASTDGGDRIVLDCGDPRVKLINRETPGPGGYAARNIGIKNAIGEYIALLDADDEWKPTFLSTISGLVLKYPGSGIYASGYEYMEKSGKTWVPTFKAIPPSPWEGLIPNYWEAALGIPPVCSSAICIPKAVFTSVGGFHLDNTKGEDRNMWLRISFEKKVAYSNTVQAVYHREVDNRVSDGRQIVECYGAVKSIDAYLSGHPNLNKRDQYLLKENRNNFVITSASQMVVAGEGGRARELLKACDTEIYLAEKVYWQAISYMPLTVLQKMRRLRDSVLKLKIHASEMFRKKNV